jgi:hypothetical protein
VPDPLQDSSPLHHIESAQAVPAERFDHEVWLSAVLQYWQGLVGLASPSA